MAEFRGVRKTGRELEGRIQQVARVYEMRKICRLRKCDPPSFTVNERNPKNGKLETHTKLMANPFVDFVGTWTERGGRMLQIEAKMTNEARLPFGSGGVTEKQMDALRDWQAAGAAVGVVWEYQLRWRFVSYDLIMAAKRSGRSSVRWDAAEEISQGVSLIFDFMPNLRRLYPDARFPAGVSLRPRPAALPPAPTIPGAW